MGFRERHPEIWSGLLDKAEELPRHNFPWKIRQLVLRGEEPTSNQLGACYRSLKLRAGKARSGRHAGATRKLWPIEKVMGKDTPEIRAEPYRFVWVDGTILVRAEGEFVGKIRGGRFMRAFYCTDDNVRDIERIALNPRGKP